MHRRRRQAALLVAVVAFVVFLPSLAATFIYDDLMLVVKNEYVHALKWLPRAFTTHLWHVSPLAAAGDANGAVDTSRRYYRPLVTCSLLFTWVLVGARAWVFHLTNVALHAATSALATTAAIRWTRSLTLGTLIGLVFAIHPTRSENVVWISGRMDVMMMLFILLSLAAFHRFERRGTWTWYAAGVLALIAALLSKEPAVMMPFVLLARERRPKSWLTFGTAAGLCVGYGVIREVFWRPEGQQLPHYLTLSKFVFTVGSYAKRIVFPWPPTLFYDEVPSDGTNEQFPWPLLVFGAVVITVALAALVVAWRRSRTAFWMLVSAAAFLGPLLNLVHNGMRDIAQDRFLYAPLLFVLVAVARLGHAPLRRLVSKRAFMLGAAGVGLAAIGLIEVRTLDYHSEEAFWRAELAQHPHDPVVLHMLARNASARGDLKHALGFYRRAQEPEALKYFHRTGPVLCHFEEAAVIAALLPDGRADELRLLSAELWRAVDPDAIPKPQVLLGYPIGLGLPDKGLREFSSKTSFHWEAALVATRVGDARRAEIAVRAAAAGRTAANPLNGVLVLARLDHLGEARALLTQIRELPSMQEGSSPRDLDALGARLARAEQITVQRDRAEARDQHDAFEALRLAELGAHWSALRVLIQSSLFDAPDTATFALQLLVACRLDAAAREYAGEHLGASGLELVANVRSQLPPNLKEMEPVPSTLEQVVAAAMRPF